MVKKKITERAQNDSEVVPLLYTEFGDKSKIIRKHWTGSMSKGKLKDRLEGIRKLRDQVAHASDYAESLAAAERTAHTIAWLLELRKR